MLPYTRGVDVSSFSSTIEFIAGCLISSARCDFYVFLYLFSFLVIIQPTEGFGTGDDDAGQGIRKYIQNKRLLYYAICFWCIIFDTPIEVKNCNG